MKGRGNWMQRLADEMEMEGERVPGFPLVEICGERRVLIEHHRGVSQYGTEQIRVRVSFGEIAVQGRNLDLARMTREQIVICGRIDCVSLIRRGGR